MNLVVLTNNNSDYGKKLIQKAEENGISLSAIVIINQPISYHIKLFNYVKKRVGFLQAIFFSVKSIIKKKANGTDSIHYNQFKAKKIYVDGNDSIELENILCELQTDILLLGQTGIIKPKIIQSAKIGVINAHPGILPSYRGIDCAKWAILNEDFSKIGCSVHWVDRGVDTGDIISKTHYHPKPNQTFDELDNQLDTLCINELIKVIIQILDGKKLITTRQNKGDGQQYYKMTIQQERAARKKSQCI
jgi:folate-dependent phosphoribosylglycinamide formyltransferase PurN